MTLRGIATLVSLATATGEATTIRETNELVSFPHGVRATLNSSATSAASARVHLVLYALPNGNTTAQSFGYRVPTSPKPDHNVQQIGAQTRWLRSKLPDTNLIVAYLECDGLGWPAWRRKNDPSGINVARIVDSLSARYPSQSTTVTLTGHSGGGAFTFAYLDRKATIPSTIDRIAFLDSNYGYKSEKQHGSKLAKWLAASPHNQLTVFAYQDYLALDRGKTFISKNHGTWGRSFAMLYDLSRTVNFRLKRTKHFQLHSALDGRIQFILLENPDRQIFHSPQVAKNGFIHALLTGTRSESKGYDYFGRPVYSHFISPPPEAPHAP